MASKTPPQFKVVTYQLNEATNYFERTSCEIGFEKLPLELKVEDTQRPEIIHSSQIIRGRIKNGKKSFFTGLLPTQFLNLFFGDHFERINGEKKNSFILFNFENENRDLTIFFFNHYKLYPKRRESFIGEQVEQINLKRIYGEIKKRGESRPPSVQNHFTGQLFND
jgi:hypothetical protein